MTSTEWRVVATFPRPARVSQRALATLTKALPGFGIAEDNGHAVTTHLTVEADAIDAAASLAVHAARSGWHAAFGASASPAQLRVLTADAHLAELSQPPQQDLVGTAEAADLLGVSKQRVRQLADTEEFPRPVAVLAMGPVYSRASVESYAAARVPRAGRPSTDLPDGIQVLPQEGGRTWYEIVVAAPHDKVWRLLERADLLTTATPVDTVAEGTRIRIASARAHAIRIYDALREAGIGVHS